MTLHQFKQLDEMEQRETLGEKGVCIADREGKVCPYFLLQIDGFYVEVWFHKRKNFLYQFRIISSVTELEPYLNQIDISNIIKQRRDIILNDFHQKRNKAAEAAAESMLKNPLSLEESLEQVNHRAKRAEIQFAKDAPEIQKRIRLITTPLQFENTVKIYQWLWRKQITLEMIPPDVLEEFMKTVHYRIFIRKK